MNGPYGNRLLVIDDEAAIGRLIEKIAQGVGFEVVVTDDPQIFVKTARLWQPTVIMLDLKMPNTDGIELLRVLAADRCPARVVIGSGSDAKILETAVRLGRERGLTMSGMLAKPVRVDRLREMLAGFRRAPRDLLAADLAEAIAADQVFLEYQPKFDCARGLFTGVEALARWHHPNHGMVRPDEFVALAEETGLIKRLTDRVTAAAARQAALWHAENAPLDVAVNISAIDVDDLDLPERLQQHCLDAGISPDTIILELTETGAMREAVQMMDVLTRLRLKGFRLAIDDFGIGYSSLIQLQRLPFSEIKIDQSFVMRSPEDDSCRIIVEIVVDLARKLGLKSVAEGVENEATLKDLIAMGCDMAQGYHLSRPLAASEILLFIRARNAPGSTPAA